MKAAPTAPDAAQDPTTEEQASKNGSSSLCFFSTTKLCLRPTWTLRRQLLTSFGTTSILAIGAVMMIATLTTHSSGQKVQTQARDSLTQQVTANLGASTRYAAETISKKLMDNLGGAAAILEEATRDRIVGYPFDFENDAHVPFVDSVTQQNMYPLDSPPLPLEWEIDNPDMNELNAHFHLGPDRLTWYGSDYSKVTTAHATYQQQGQCDPNELDPNAPTYFPDCSDANNDVISGGRVHPTVTNYGLWRKGGDLTAILKPLYESHSDVKNLGIYFANSGAGAVLAFPGTVTDARLNYTSIGCDWLAGPNLLLSHRNNQNVVPLGTSTEIQRCQRNGLLVTTNRRYNPLERGWCRDQAQSPGTTQIHGPYLDAMSEHLWLLTIGRAIFDRQTKHFIGCTLLDVSINRIEAILEGVEVGSTSEIALVSWEDGTVVASPQWDTATAQSTSQIWDLDLGIDRDTFTDMKDDTVDFSRFWTPEEVQEAYKTKITRHKGKLVAAYPVPVPTEYDEAYRPKYLVVLSIDQDEVYSSVDEMDQAIDDDSSDIIAQTLIVGFAGMALVLIIIVVVSLFLTKPLSWMASIADQIVANAGNHNLEQGVDLEQEQAFYACTPKTEVTYLVEEFRKMIHGLGGSGAAKVASPGAIHDVQNIIKLDEHDVLQSLYRPNENQHSGGFHREAQTVDYKGTTKVNWGTHVRNKPAAPTHPAAQRKLQSVASWRGILKSPLFWWITILIVAPLVLTMVAICVIVSLDVTEALPSWLEDVEAASVALERYAINTAAIARAYFSEQVISEAVRDTHLMTRVTGWLLFGALERSTSFTAMDQSTEECKVAARDRQCSFFDDPDRAFCDCEWDDVYNHECSFTVGDSRQKQKMLFAGQSHDTDQATGDRYQISYTAGVANEFDFSPETTAWWNDLLDLPGAMRGSNASGYVTTYDRVRVLSALAIALFPIFNHARNPTSENYFGMYVGLEMDGMMIGYEGCEYAMVEYSNFRSTHENKASTIRNGTLCPLGKYGYDCRCRDWYDKGKQKGMSLEAIPVHVTAPYVFTGGQHIATSMTSPLVDPRGSIHVGQVLLDFIPGAIVDALEDTIIGQSETGNAILITPESDVLGGDTVVGPGYSLPDGTSPPIENLLLPFDNMQSNNMAAFKDTILAPMKNGTSHASSSFYRTNSGGKQEQIYVAWAPVRVTALRPLNPASFDGGVEAHDTHIYTVGIMIPEADLVLPFNRIENDIDEEIDRSTAVLIVLIVVAAAIAAGIAGNVACSIARTVRTLLEIVFKINDGTFGDVLPKVEGGSLEANKVYDAFERLFKVVRFSNQAFFKGDMGKAYAVLADSLELFCNLNNNKAIGIASNNLGNTLLQLGREFSQKSNSSFENLTYDGFLLSARALQHFDEAVQIGEEEYQSAPEELKGDYAQQQANRHFNRGVFLLETRQKSNPALECQPRENGFRDMQIARDYDAIASMRKPQKPTADDWSLLRFETLLRRLQGLSMLLMDESILSDLERIWNPDDLLDEAESLYFAECDREQESALFRDISKVGRLQQLECQKINVLVAKGRRDEALRLATRMIVEDEFILSTVLPVVSNQLLDYLTTILDMPSLDESQTSSLSDIWASLVNMGGTSKHVAKNKNVYFCLDYSGSMSLRCHSSKTGVTSTRILTANKNLLKIFDDYVGDNDNVGFLRFNHIVDNTYAFNLTKKQDHAKELRYILSQAVTTDRGTRMYKALSYAVDQIASAEFLRVGCKESWIVALTDGMSADERFRTMEQIKRLNTEQGYKIHVIIVGVEVPESVVKDCQHFCTVSEKSAYIDARGGLDAMDQAFEAVAAMISGSGMTMETF